MIIDDILPEGWSSTTLGVITTPSKVRTEPSQVKGVPYLSLEHIESSTTRIIGRGSSADVRSTKSVFHAGDVLYGKLRPYLNKVCIPTFDGICSTDILVLPKSPDIESKFLMWFLTQSDVVSFANHHSSGVQLPRISFEKLAELELVLPPLAEQKRIVASVETLLAEANAAQDCISKVPAILARFREAILTAACSGRLTADWRKRNSVESSVELFADIQRERVRRFDDELNSARLGQRRSSWAEPELLAEPNEEDLAGQPEIPDTWLYCRLGNLAEVVRGASPRPAGDPRYFGGRIPWITVAELTKDDRVYLDEVRQFVTDEGRERSRFIEAGTLLLTNSGATLGVPKITRLGGCINDGSVALVDIPLTSQLYLYYFLKSQTRRLRDINQGAAQPNLNTEIVKDIVTPLPPLAEQQEVVRLVESMFVLADAIEKGVATALTHVGRITPSVLTKAFRGELVPTEAEVARQEGRDYEPASVLLERIPRHGGQIIKSYSRASRHSNKQNG